jgi:hypothetical protein
MLFPSSGWPELPAGTLSPHPPSHTAHGRRWPPLPPARTGTAPTRRRPAPGPRPPARHRQGPDQPHRRGPPLAKTAHARRCAPELAGAAHACPSAVLGAPWSPHRILRAAPELAAPRSRPWSEQLAAPSPGRSSPCLPLYGAPRFRLFPKLAGIAHATGRGLSCPPLARARRRHEVEERSMAEQRGGARPWGGRGIGGGGRRGGGGARRQGPAS